jgi:ketosteroid isomerase-like protein
MNGIYFLFKDYFTLFIEKVYHEQRIVSTLEKIPAIMQLIKNIAISMVALLLFSQAKSQSGVHSAGEVANAEKNFAKKALETNTRQAFLEYYADTVIVFRNGGPANGKEDWSKRKADSSELWWQPVFADMAGSGDFGYTTGPWEWKKLKTDNTPSAYGYYNSVWKKGKNGIWQVVIDIGVPTAVASAEKNKPIGFSAIHSKPVSGDVGSLKRELFDVERTFLSICRKDNQAAYAKYISGETRIYRPNNLPYIAAEAIKRALADTSLIFSFDLIDGDIASSGDLGYIYGKVKATGVYNGQPVNADLNYMRIWKRENTGNWKIVLDVIGGR